MNRARPACARHAHDRLYVYWLASRGAEAFSSSRSSCESRCKKSDCWLELICGVPSWLLSARTAPVVASTSVELKSSTTVARLIATAGWPAAEFERTGIQAGDEGLLSGDSTKGFATVDHNHHPYRVFASELALTTHTSRRGTADGIACFS